jgi:hypothetical protein
MKLSNETLSILKNYANINEGIFFKQGKTLKTVGPHKNILSEVVIKEDIPKDFGIYNLNNFLSVVSLHKDDTSFEFSEKNVFIVGNKGRSKIEYRFCDPSMIVIPPEKQLSMPSVDIEFDLSSDDFDWIMKASHVLSSPHIAVESDGVKVSIVNMDLQNDSAHKQSLDLQAKGNGDKYRMIFKTEVFNKILPGNYEVKISSKGISHFTNKNISLQYWLTTETGSKYEKV